MEVLPCSGVQYGGESDCPQQSSGRELAYDKKSKLDEHGQQVTLTEVRMDGMLQNAERPQMERQVGAQGTVDELKISESHCNGASDDTQVAGQKSCRDSRDYDDENDDDYDDADEQSYCKETSLASDNCHLIVDSIESELPNSNREGESSFSEPKWLEGDESVALWVKVLLFYISFKKHMTYLVQLAKEISFSSLSSVPRHWFYIICFSNLVDILFCYSVFYFG